MLGDNKRQGASNSGQPIYHSTKTMKASTKPKLSQYVTRAAGLLASEEPPDSEACLAVLANLEFHGLRDESRHVEQRIEL